MKDKSVGGEKRKEMKRATILLIVLILAFVISNVSAAGIGLAPSSFTMEDTLKGGSCDRIFTVFNTVDEPFDYEFEGTGDIGEWVSFYALDGKTPIETIKVPGKSTEKIIARFSIPGDTPNGVYTGTVDVLTALKNVTVATTEEIGIVAQPILRMSSRGRIEVTGKQILTGTVKSITTVDTEVNYPLRIKVEFQNTGNVIAYPTINVSISKEESLVDRLISDKTVVKPGTTETIPVEWNTTGQIPGEYSVDVTVSLNGDELATKSLSVKILPAGTLTADGDLISISTADVPSVGRYIKIPVTFENTGTIDTKAKFVGELYINGNLVDVVNTDELLVPVGEKSDLIAYLKIETPGDYKIKGHVLYEGKKTDEKELAFFVPKPDSATETETTTETATEAETDTKVPGFGIIGTLIATIVVFVIAKKSGQKGGYSGKKGEK